MVTIDEMLREARSALERVTPEQAWAAMQAGAALVDIRPEFQRGADGEIPGVVVIERVHLDWRCDPASSARVREAVDHNLRWIVCCDEGYPSSLAATSLRALGLHGARDVIDGLRACRSAGMPVAHPPRPTRPRLYEP